MKIRWIESKKLGLHLKEVPGRRICPKKVAKKRQIDFKGATPVAKKHKLHVEATQDADSGERVALDERTTQILEEELQNIMIKVWQALPDMPQTPAERYVTEQLRSEASDDIRNVLGLNVTKRLLNVYNPLSVRIIFPAKPEGRDLMEFTKAYHITEIRPKGRGDHSYFALVARIADFDRLCNSKDVRCGSLTATVYPYYRFSDLPMKLNTGYIKKRKITSKSKQDEKEVADKKITENSSNDKIVKKATPSSENVQPTVKSKSIVKSDLSPKKTIELKNEMDSNEVTLQSNINKVNVAKKADANQKVEPNTRNIVKQNNAIPTKASEPKPNVVKGTQNIEKATTQNNPQKPKPTQITQEANTVKNVNIGKPSTPVSKPKPNQASQAVVATKKVTDATPKTTATTNITKPKTNQVTKESVATKKGTESTPKLVEKATVPNKKLEPSPQAVKVAEKPAVTKPNQNQDKKEVVTTKKVEKSKTKLSFKNVEIINSEMYDQDEEINEDDEMNDEEILALISTGVVVDECSGSDED